MSFTQYTIYPELGTDWDVSQILSDGSIPYWAVPPLESVIEKNGDYLNAVIASRINAEWGSVTLESFTAEDFSGLDPYFAGTNRAEILAQTFNDNLDIIEDSLNELTKIGEFDTSSEQPDSDFGVGQSLAQASSAASGFVAWSRVLAPPHARSALKVLSFF